MSGRVSTGVCIVVILILLHPIAACSHYYIICHYSIMNGLMSIGVGNQKFDTIRLPVLFRLRGSIGDNRINNRQSRIIRCRLTDALQPIG